MDGKKAGSVHGMDGWTEKVGRRVGGWNEGRMGGWMVRMTAA